MHGDDFNRRLVIPYLTSTMLDEATALAARCIADEDFHQYDGYQSTEKFANIDGRLSGIDALVNDSEVCTGSLIMLLPPHFNMDVHIDIYYLKSRKTAIFWPLLPMDDIAPTLFYESQHALTPCHVVNWSRGEPQLLNVRPHWHNTINNDSWRAMLQLNFKLDYDEVLQRIHAGNLFHTISCGFADEDN